MYFCKASAAIFVDSKQRKATNIIRYIDMTEKEKMLAGQIYSATDPQLLEELAAAREVIHDFNRLRPSEHERKMELLKVLLGHIGDDQIIVNQPFHCDYGKQIRVGRRFFANFNFTVLDEASVNIGDDCFIGPNVSIYTACHSTDPIERNSRQEWAKPVTIGDNVTIGAGSVVVADIPSNCVAVGNPCKVVRQL